MSTGTPGTAGHAGTPENPGPDAGRRLRWSGTRAFLIECGSLQDVVALHARLTAHPLPGQVEALAAAETVAVSFTHPEAAAAGAAEVSTWGPVDAGLAEGGLVEIEVVYDGADLAEAGDLTGLGAEGLVRWHTETEFTGAFGGFAPGFTYLAAPADSPVDVSRRPNPRTSVPPGAVAIAGRFSAVYPRSSPGGWQLLGRTTSTMWDLDRDHPALVAPGDRVRFRPIRAAATLTASAEAPVTTASAEAAPATTGAGPALCVDHPGLQSLVQDLGRPGLGNLGVAASGAADPDSARQANRLVGNRPGAAVVEILLGGAALRARGHLVLALTGAEVPARITTPAPAPEHSPVPSPVPSPAGPMTRPAPIRAPFALYDGELLDLGEPEAGLRTYLAVRGGIEVGEAGRALGSAATDTLSTLGPAPLAAGTELGIGPADGLPAVGRPEPALRPLPRAGQATELRIVPGPRDDWFGEAGLERLTGQDWRVTQQSNRVGVRLDVAPSATAGPEAPAEPLERIRTGELASEGAVPGALQVPPSGLPILFLADHPVTGGYPVIAVVVPEDLPLAAQLPPGATVRFTRYTHSDVRNAS